MQNKKDNIIQFPVANKEATEAQATGVTAPKAAVSPRKMPLWLPAALVTTLVASYAGNRWVGSSSTDLASQSGGRSIASSVDTVEMDRDVRWEQQVAKDLSRKTRRELASIQYSHRPTAEEELRFGFLSSQYNVTLQNGKLSQIQLPKDLSQIIDSDLVYLGGGAKFIERNRELMPDGYVSQLREDRQVAGDQIFETYALLGQEQQKLGEMRVGLDKYGRLLSIKVQPFAQR